LYNLEPWGEFRADYRMGIQMASIYNMFRGKDSKPLNAMDFMPFVERPEPTPEDILRKVEMWNAALGGKDMRKQ